ncbi:hypothetical protein C806_03274 [Lachnospiraceae bacterium 3-1]|nr:hypothetical protein C806_03274 [Lachnospiraceae bacterium 3-1]
MRNCYAAVAIGASGGRHIFGVRKMERCFWKKSIVLKTE